ncbi:hypothetical protein F4677DRAFT_460532 [Hypoxylon crocopeplum]|nr:hypothetical protein F4677DRAFT_460532 [Hypoxylon crocopeplum]
MLKGSIALTIKFAGLLTPRGPLALPKMAVPGVSERLPFPTRDVNQVKRDIRESGYGVIKTALTPTQVAVTYGRTATLCCPASEKWATTLAPDASDSERLAVLMPVMRSFVYQQENNVLSLRADVRAAAPGAPRLVPGVLRHGCRRRPGRRGTRGFVFWPSG